MRGTHMRASYIRMESEWFLRLKQILEHDPRSKRAISIAAGRGPNFVQQMLKDGKEPGADKLASILAAYPPEIRYYVLTGIRATERDIQFLALLADRHPDKKEKALTLLEAILAEEAPSEPSPSPPRSSEPKR